jgi:hypothetical protein
MKMKDMTKTGAISDQDVCLYLFALAGFVQDTADLYYDNYVKGQGKPSPRRPAAPGHRTRKLQTPWRSQY